VWIVLAGGASRRMGQPKVLLDFFGRRWIDAQLEAIGGDTIVVSSIPIDGVRVILQPRPDDPPWSSLKLGLDAASGAVLVLPIDVPVAPGIALALERTIGAHDAAVPVHRGRRGHPVLLSAAFAERLRAIEDSRLDHELARARCAELEVGDPVVRMNLNTEDEWRAWLSSADCARCYPRAR
jgi:molybdenum cofactor cytidylyltransferase